MSVHSHCCQVCRIFWNCKEGKRCKVERAVKINKRGPYCNMCLHGVMFLRYAGSRGCDAQVMLKVLVSHELEMAKPCMHPDFGQGASEP